MTTCMDDPESDLLISRASGTVFALFVKAFRKMWAP